MNTFQGVRGFTVTSLPFSPSLPPPFPLHILLSLKPMKGMQGKAIEGTVDTGSNPRCQHKPLVLAMHRQGTVADLSSPLGLLAPTLE